MKLMAIGCIITQLLIKSAIAPEASAKESTIQNAANTEMFEAIANADLKRLHSVLEAGNANVNARKTGGRDFSALALAIFARASSADIIAMTTLLLEHGADPTQSIVPENINLPIHSALQPFKDHSLAIIQALLSRDNTIVNSKAILGYTPLNLLLSAFSKRTQENRSARIAAVKCLLENGADIVLTDDSGLTALKLAEKSHEDSEIIEILESHNREVKRRIVAQLATDSRSLAQFPPGLLPLIVDFIQ